MKTLNLYIVKSYAVTLVMAIGILTFALMGVKLLELFKYLSRGIPVTVASSFLLYVIPFSLTLAIPCASLVTIMLIFGRMSADNEITAMRACGVSILQIIAPLIIFTFILTLLCLLLQLDVAPKYAGKARGLFKEVTVNQPLALFEPGEEITQFPNRLVYIDERVGKKGIKGIEIFNINKDRTTLKQHIKAVDGSVDVDKGKEILYITLNGVNMTEYGKGENDSRRLVMDKLIIPIPYGEKFNERKIAKRVKFLPVRELFGRLVLTKELLNKTVDLELKKKRLEQLTRLEVELNSRIALALSPIAFLLLGLPLAIRTSRRETSAGLFLSAFFAGIYLVAVMICHSLYMKPYLYPQVLLWIPSLLYQVLGVVFIFKIARR